MERHRHEAARIAESAGEQLAAVVRGVLGRPGLTDEQRGLTLPVVPTGGLKHRRQVPQR